MVLNNNFITSLKGFIMNLLIDFRKIFITGLAITIWNLLISYLIFALLFILSPGASSNSNSGALGVGTAIVTVTFAIAMMVTLSNGEIVRKFVFPINRDVFAAGSFIFIIIGSVIFLGFLSLISFIEILLGRFMELFFENFAFFNEITLANYGIGLWCALCYMVFFISLIYFISMYFYRFKIQTSIVLGILVASIITFPVIRTGFLNAVRFIFFEQSILVLSIKLWALTIMYHMLAYIPLKRMEVVK